MNRYFRTQSFGLCFFLLLLPEFSNAQLRDIGSLSSLPDSMDIMAQIEKAQKLRDRQPDSALLVLNHALEQSRKAGFKKGIRNALLNLMQLHYLNNRYETSIKIGQLLRQSADSNTNKDAFFYSYYGSALAYHQMDRFDSAFRSYAQALLFLPDTSATNIGIYGNMGELLHRMGEGEKALTYFKRAIDRQEQHRLQTKNAISSVTSAYMNMGSIYSVMDSFEAADNYFDKSMKLAKGHGLKEELYSIKRLQAFMYNNRKQPRKALQAVKEAKAILQELDQAPRVSMAAQLDMAAGEAYLQLGRYELAAEALTTALHATDSIQVNERSIISYKLSRAYDSLGDYEKAYRFATQGYDLSEQIKSKEVQSRLNESEVRYQSAEKDKELALHRMQLSESKRNIARKNLIMVSVSAAALVLLLLFWNTYRAYQRRQRINRQEKEIEGLRSMMAGEEKERARLARELHDGIGGMLAAIKMNVGSLEQQHSGSPVSGQMAHIANMLQETSAEVRTTAHNLVPDALSKYDLKEAIIQYIQKINDSHGIQATLHLPQQLGELGKAAELMLYRMVQELVQNVSKHAAASLVDIQLMAFDDTLSLTVEDNGRGMEADYSSGFGLDNLRYRVQALHGDIDIDSLPGKGTTVRISFKREQLAQLNS